MGAPTGIVTFFDGSNSLGTACLNSGLPATLQASLLGLGTHSLTAQYTGDTNFTASISGVVVPTTQAQDFSLVASALTPTSVTAGRTASSRLTVASLYGFNGAVLLACSVSPKPSLAPTCTVNPASLTPPGDGSPAASMLTIGTTGSTAALAHSVVWRDGGALRLLWLPIPALAFLATGLGSRRPWRSGGTDSWPCWRYACFSLVWRARRLWQRQPWLGQRRKPRNTSRQLPGHCYRNIGLSDAHSFSDPDR
jgi:hypothetical protein